MVTLSSTCSQHYQLHLIIWRLCVTGSQLGPPGAGAQGAWGGPAAASGAAGCRAGWASFSGWFHIPQEAVEPESRYIVGGVQEGESEHCKAPSVRAQKEVTQSQFGHAASVKASHRASWDQKAEKDAASPPEVERVRTEREDREPPAFCKINLLSLPVSSMPQIHEWR
uniref:Uncharacterized protein n=1 Tax=Rangifer tarandus platyrhynchus TaxID=3082113 RepID=A0ACB0F5R6_RANTA|nr:unnamed protein product [Rangifer tarandus platyrhynchus]